MSLVQLLAEERIVPSLQSTNKEGVLRELSGLLAREYPLLRPEEVLQTLMDREHLGTTGIGEGIAIPHGKVKSLDQMAVCFGRSISGIPFDAQDGQPVHFFFLLLAPEAAAETYLRVLAQITRFLKKGLVRDRLMKAPDQREILAIFAEAT